MIKFYHGCIGSGKSLHLLNSYLTSIRKHNPEEVCLVKPASDTRTAGVFTRFGNIEVDVDINYSWDTRLDWLLALTKKKIFFIDETQFMPEGFVETIFKQRQPNQEFHLYGLKNDYLGVMWEPIKYIMNVADEIVEIPTNCDICKTNKASFNKKTDSSKQGNQVGFHYIPVCWKCFKG